MSQLFSIIIHLCGENDINLPKEESECVNLLKTIVQKNKALSMYEFTHKKFHIDMLPIISQIINKTIGVIDENNNIVQIPYQWFSENTMIQEIEVIRQTKNSDGSMEYDIDYDDSYIMKYEEKIQKEQWTFNNSPNAIFNTQFKHELSSYTSSSNSSHVSKFDQNKLIKIVNEQLKIKNKQSSYDENRFTQMWTQEHSFDCSHSSLFPNVTDPHFKEKLYAIPMFSLGQNMVQNTKNMHHLYTYRHHQQLMRNYMSPLTPYRSLLLYHATGTGKTLTTFGITEQFRNITYTRNQKIHIACPNREIMDEFSSYLDNMQTNNNDSMKIQSTKDYVYYPYFQEIQHCHHDHEKSFYKTYAKQHYHIAKHFNIFSKSYYQFTDSFRKITNSWFVLLPSMKNIKRKDNTIVIECTKLTNDDVAYALTMFNKIHKIYNTMFQEKWTYSHKQHSEKTDFIVSNT